MDDYIIIIVIYTILAATNIILLRARWKKEITKEESRVIWGIISFCLGVYGFFHLAIWVGPPAIVAAIIALYTPPGEKVIESPYRILAFLGLALGVLETIFAVLGFAGII